MSKAMKVVLAWANGMGRGKWTYEEGQLIREENGKKLWVPMEEKEAIAFLDGWIYGVMEVETQKGGRNE